MKKIIVITSLILSMGSAASAAVVFGPIYGMLAGLIGIAAQSTSTDTHEDFGITKDFYAKSKELKHIIKWTDSYSGDKGLYHDTKVELESFSDVVVDIFGADTKVDDSIELKIILIHAQNMREYSLRGFTLEAQKNKTVGEMVSDLRTSAQLALSLTSYCRWNRTSCISE